MYDLNITVTKVLGTCTADPPMKPGDYFTVRDGDIRVPKGGYICLWALQSLLPIITPKEREILEERDEDWMWRVHHVQCPDPEGRVIFRIVRSDEEVTLPPFVSAETDAAGRAEAPAGDESALLRNLRVVVEEVRGRCTSGMRPGDYFLLRSGRITIPAGRHFCLYALQAALPLLPAKQRPLHEGDWLRGESHVVCPDPAGNVIMRIEQYPWAQPAART
jgi:uncharacterized repeat protein (TIGR04076 family)